MSGTKGHVRKHCMNKHGAYTKLYSKLELGEIINLSRKSFAICLFSTASSSHQHTRLSSSLVHHQHGAASAGSATRIPSHPFRVLSIYLPSEIFISASSLVLSPSPSHISNLLPFDPPTCLYNLPPGLSFPHDLALCQQSKAQRSPLPHPN